jgi:PHYB activation tagged suppressor 1
MATGAGVWALQLVALLPLLLAVWWHLVWRPRAVARSFARQGVRGAPYTFLVGSMLEMKRLVVAGRSGVAAMDAGNHNIVPVVLRPLHVWTAAYGLFFFFHAEMYYKVYENLLCLRIYQCPFGC